MPKALVTFHELLIASQDLATANPNDSHMFSQAIFSLELEGHTYPDMSVTIRQPFGTDFATEPLEVEPPAGSYQGNWNHSEFSEAVEDYYRGLIGEHGRIIRFPATASHSLRNILIQIPKCVEINIPA